MTETENLDTENRKAIMKNKKQSRTCGKYQTERKKKKRSKKARQLYEKRI